MIGGAPNGIFRSFENPFVVVYCPSIGRLFNFAGANVERNFGMNIMKPIFYLNLFLRESAPLSPEHYHPFRYRNIQWTEMFASYPSPPSPVPLQSPHRSSFVCRDAILMLYRFFLNRIVMRKVFAELGVFVCS